MPNAEALPGVRHELEVRVTGPDFQPAGNTAVVGMEVQPGPLNPPGWDVRSFAPALIAVDVTTEGTYSIEMRTDRSFVTIPVMFRSTPP